MTKDERSHIRVRGGSADTRVIVDCARCGCILILPHNTPATHFEHCYTGFCVDHQHCDK